MRRSDHDHHAKALPRRTVLAASARPCAAAAGRDGAGATALSRTAARPIQRFGVVYVPNGVVIDKWTPALDGAAFEFKPILEPLKPFRERLLILTGLTQNKNGLAAKSGAVHGRCATKYLTGAIPGRSARRATTFARMFRSTSCWPASSAGKARQSGADLESGDKGAGTVRRGKHATDTLSWRGPTTPLPMEHNPRVVFERMFGDGGSTDPAVRAVRLKSNRSLLDSVVEKIGEMRRGLGPSDASKLTEYLEAVRDIERRIQRAEEQMDRELPAFDQPAGVPAAFRSTRG